LSAGLIVAFATLGGCGLRDELRGETEAIKADVRDMRATTGEMYDALRQGDTAVMRRSILESMMQARSPQRKAAEAAHWMMAFEFQRWGLAQSRRETAEYRCLLATAAVRELLMNVHEFMRAGQVEPQPFAISSATTANASGDSADELANRQQNLNAVAAVLHALNPVQADLVQRTPGLSPLSLLILLEESLVLGRSIRSGELRLSDVTPLVREVLIREDAVRLLLQARYNYLLFAAIHKASSLDQENLEVLNVMGVSSWNVRVVAWRALRILTVGWEPDLSRLNTAELSEAVRMLDWGRSTAESLLRAGVTPRLVEGLARIQAKTSRPALPLVAAGSEPERQIWEQSYVDLLGSYADWSDAPPFMERRAGGPIDSLSTVLTRGLAELGVRGSVETPCLKSSQ
jgi:hypothetical protein